MPDLISHKINKSQLKVGDHIYSWRRAHIYAHHGIYVGEGKVIHFTCAGRFHFSSSFVQSSNPCPNCDVPTGAVDGTGVKSSCLDCFLKGGKLYLFRYGVSQTYFLAKTRGGTCTTAPSDSSEEALHRARYLLQNNCWGRYSLFSKNCEDFAIYCKTSLLVTTREVIINPASWGIGGQTGSVIAAGISLALGVPVYYLHRLLSDIGVRRDVSKVPVEELGRRLVLLP